MTKLSDYAVITTNMGSFTELLGRKESKTVDPKEFSVSNEAIRRIDDYRKNASRYYQYLRSMPDSRPHFIEDPSDFRAKIDADRYRALNTYNFFNDIAGWLKNVNRAITLTPVRSKELRPKTIDTALIPEDPVYCRIGEERLNEILELIYPRGEYKKQKEIRGFLSKGKTVRLIAPKK